MDPTPEPISIAPALTDMAEQSAAEQTQTPQRSETSPGRDMPQGNVKEPRKTFRERRE